MKFGAMNFPVKSLHEEIETIGNLGFDYLELAMDPPMAHYSFLETNKHAIKRQLEQYSLGLICHLPTFVMTADLTPSLRRASVDEMVNSLRVAAQLGAAKVVLHPSMVFGMASFVPETARTYFYTFLEKMISLATQLELMLCLENMMPRNILGVYPDELEEIFDRYPSLKLTLDTGHANIRHNNKSRLDELIKRLGPRIAHLHLSDNLGKSDDHLEIGAGTIDFEKLLLNLKKLGYDDTVTLEIFTPDRTKLRVSRDRIESILREL